MRELTAAARSLQDTVGVLPAKHRRRLADVEEQLRDEDDKSREAVAGVGKKGRLRDAVAAEVTTLERRVQEAQVSAARSKNRSAITRTLIDKALHQPGRRLSLTISFLTNPSPTEDALKNTTVGNRIRLIEQRRKRTILDTDRCI